MIKMSLPILLLALFVAGALCIIEPDVYQEIKEKAPFKVLDLEKIQEIFKDMKFIGYEVSHKNKLEDKRLAQEITKSRGEEKPFLALDTQITLPKEWDWRKIMPECFRTPLAQRDCGSCYAFATISALEERFCINSKGSFKPNLSQQDLISCDPSNEKCGGGYIVKSWEYFENTGVCSYNCKPYVSYDGTVPQCYKACDNPVFSYIFKWKAKPDSMKIIYDDVQKIKEEIYLRGPISTTMDTWEDLSAYGGGYYFHTTGKATDAHAINIVGWGYDEKIKRDYWIIKNSWGPDWGEGGYFKVVTGLYTIGELVVASLPLT